MDPRALRPSKYSLLICLMSSWPFAGYLVVHEDALHSRPPPVASATASTRFVHVSACHKPETRSSLASFSCNCSCELCACSHGKAGSRPQEPGNMHRELASRRASLSARAYGTCPLHRWAPHRAERPLAHMASIFTACACKRVSVCVHTLGSLPRSGLQESCGIETEELQSLCAGAQTCCQCTC